MAKVRLYGETSGYVDLKAPDVANDVTITLPNESGPFATEAFATAAGVAGSGLVAVKSAIFTGTQAASLGASGNVAVTNLSITHEVADPANKLIISAYLSAASSADINNVGIAIHDGDGLINIGDAAGSASRVTSGGTTGAAHFNVLIGNWAVTFVHTPGTGSKTYTVRAVNVDANPRTIRVNRNTRDNTTGTDVRATSGLVIQEVKV